MEDVEFWIAKLALARGDVLVVSFPHGEFSPATTRHAVAMVEAAVPDGVKVLFKTDAVDLSVLTRAEIEART